MKKIILLSLLLILSQAVICQDVILLKTGDRIICKITATDSTKVYFDVKDNHTDIHASVSKNSVQSIRYSSTDPNDKNFSSFYTQVNVITFSFGVSMPLGAFASDDPTSEKAGLAGSGLNLNLVSVNSLSKVFGFAIKGFYSTNKFKAEKLGTVIASVNNANVSNNTVYYKSGGVLIGIIARTPLDRVSVYCGALVGYGGLWEPEVSFLVVSSQGVGWLKMSKVNAGSFIYNICGGIGLNMGKHLEIFLNADFIHGNFQFGDYTISSSGTSATTTDRGEQRYSTVNLSVGLGLKF